MYCRECGEEIKFKKAVICPKCGCKVGEGNKYCNNCGKETKSDNQAACMECGKGFRSLTEEKRGKPKNKLVTILLCLFLGEFGAHRYYLGKVGSGIIQFISCIFLIGFIWVFIDFISIITENLEPENGYYV